uniref:protein-tyrosine-phosphatase n=1 Tax=Hucho hucho TaxID=62062 RepID=A0A4W5QNX0_9TELE
MPSPSLSLSLCLSLSPAPPRFTKVPVDQIGVSGGVVSFVCQATGDPKPRVSWNKKGKKVNSQRIETIEFDEGAGAVLRIQPLRAPRDENIYECVAENSEGEVNVNAKLSIIREDLLPTGFPNIDMGPQLKVVERTRTATMLCAASGNPDPEITWFKDFLPIDPNASNGRIKQLRSGALQIENSEETDQGKYECVASNVEGVRYSSPANLYVRVRRVPPRFSIPPTSHEIMPGGSVNITCVAVGSPMPYVKWMLNSEDLTPEDEMPVGRNVLELNSVRESANYTCVAMSSLGIIEAVAQITVKSLPKPPGIPMVTETTATSVTITWDSGNPDPVSYYIIQYRAKSPDSKFETMDGITTTRYSIGGLYPNTEYEIRVSAFNTIGQGPPSEPVETRTGEQAPASPPRNIQARIISQNTMMVRWDEPEEPNGQIKGYRVYYTMDPSQLMSLWQIHNVQDSIITTIQSLVASETYTIRVLAFTSVGDGPFSDPIHVKVLESSNVTCCSVELAWSPPVLAERNGDITEYTLAYQETGVGGTPRELSLPAIQSSYVLNSLKPNSAYDVKIRAHTSVGPGPYSPPIQYRTVAFETGMAYVPKNFTVKWVTKTTVLLTWKFAERRFPFRCTIEYNRQKMDVDARLTKALVTSLRPNTTYEFRVTCQENTEGGPRHRVVARTAPPILVKKPKLDLYSENFYVVVVPLKKGSGTVRHLKNPDEMDLEELLRDITPKRRTRRQLSQADGKKPYITACFKQLPITFTLGTEHRHSSCESKPLEPGQEYVFFLLADPMSISLSRSMEVDPLPIETGGDGLIWVVGPVLAVVFIICIVIAILLYKNRKRKESEPRTKCLLNNAEITPHHPTDPVEMRRINFQTPGTLCTGASHSSFYSGMMNHPPIPIAELAEHTELLKANDNLKLSQEYEVSGLGSGGSWDHSHQENNCRILCDFVLCSVCVFCICVLMHAGLRFLCECICVNECHSLPLLCVWECLWTHPPRLLSPQIKCDQYWPSRGTETYGMTQVTLLDTIELATFCVRTFSLHKNGSSEKREVRQFQFTAWPDHGVPEYPTPFLAFLRRVKTCNPPDAGPIIAHCSAGVGRTGCFIVIDAMLERIKHEKTVDIYGHVTLMRSQRNYMVQTEDQYSFIHDALLEAVACGNTEVAARSLYSYIQKLAQVETGEHVTGMELEFKRLANSKAHTSRFISANLPCNKFKNRLVNIMPYETTRVCLQPIRGLEGSDYINASFIDGYRQQKAYIATQGPLAETTEDFWRMLWENNSTIVVMLTKLREMGREKCHQYWPAERSARYQYFVVDPMAEYNMPQYILREFKVTDARDGQSRTVRQFQFTDWPEQGVPKSGEGFIDFIGQVHKTKEQFGQDGPISVHCSAGVGRTGVFITLSIVLERMRYEGVVDIFQTVKMLRTQRPAMVQTEDEYQFSYQAGLEYLGSFDHYAT